MDSPVSLDENGCPGSDLDAQLRLAVLHYYDALEQELVWKAADRSTAVACEKRESNKAH